MNHTLETLMEIADAYAYQKALIHVSNMFHSQILETDEAREALRAALVEAIPQEPEKVTGWSDGLSQDYDAKLGRWFADRPGAKQQLRETLASPQPVAPHGGPPQMEMHKIVNFQCQCGKVHGFPEAMIPAQPVRELLNKSEWPKHPSAYLNDAYMGYSKATLDDYAMQVLRAHGIGGDK